MEQESILNKELTGKHALVTGGAHGIGGAISNALHQNGAKVTITGRNIKKLETLSNKLDGINTYTLDVCDENSIKSVFENAINNHGHIDILVNNAGIADSSPFLKIDNVRTREIMETNVISAITCIQAVLPGMIKKNWGRIINISSLAGLKGQPYIAPYCASKHALIGLTRSLAAELAKTSITVNAVCPGYVETEMVAQAINSITTNTGRSNKDARTQLENMSPQNRIIDAKEVAATALWLSKPGSESVTGQSIALAGGEWM
tara:strand:+ start:40267 stop:41052 length:786 start_codon:yes stop_codon:yes gene_type:complete